MSFCLEGLASGDEAATSHAMIANLPSAIDEEKIAQFCRERGIRKMSLFGSVLRSDSDREGETGSTP